MRDFIEKLAKVIDDDEDDIQPEPKRNAKDLIHELYERYDDFTKRHQFKPGDLVRWKPGLAHKKEPKPGMPAIVVEVLDEPVYEDERDSATPYFREPLDLVLGVIVNDTFVCFHYDSRRFEPWK